MAFVIDSSVALAWLLPDDQPSAAEALADRMEVETSIAPSLWPLEVANALLTARRRDRLTDRDVDRLLEVFSALPVEIESVPPKQLLRDIVALARRHRLTTYDAIYVELARRRGLPLATLDSRLAEACGAVGVPVLP